MTQIKPWIEISRETVLQKYGRKIDKVIFELPDGSKSDYYIAGQNSDEVSVLAITIENKVILVKQFRPGPQKFLSELPGGDVDKNEKPLEAIKRELLEESGYTGDFEFVTESIIDAYADYKGFHFVATNCKKVQEIKNSPSEQIELELIDIDDFKKLLRKGQMSCVDTGYFGLDHLGLL